MRFAIAYSKRDPAGINILKQFKKITFAPDMPIIELERESIYSDDLNERRYPKLRNIDFILFATKHKSESKKPSLSIHAPGNFRQADFGGKSTKICNTSSYVMKYLFKKLNEISEKENLKGYEVTLEATHHGPLIEIPCCFIELGSSEEQWEEEIPAKIIAKTIFSLQNYQNSEKWISSIAIGGPHYCPNFNKLQLNSEYAIGHIIANYNSPINELMIKQAEERTLEQVKEVLIDWKSFNSEERNNLIRLIEKQGIKIKRI